MVPHKIVISDSYSIYIEITTPTFQTEGETVIHMLGYPTELNNLFNLFKPETGVAILLTHNHTYEVETAISADEMEEPRTWMFQLDDMQSWAQIHILALSRATILLFLSFIIINFDRMLPQPYYLNETLHFDQTGATTERIMAIIGKCLAYIQFDEGI